MASSVALDYYVRAIDSTGQNIFHVATAQGTITNWAKVVGFALSLNPGSSGTTTSTKGISVSLPETQFNKLSQTSGVGGKLASVAIEGLNTNSASLTPYVEYIYQSCVLSSLQFSSDTTEGTVGFNCASSKVVYPTKTSSPPSTTTPPGWNLITNTPTAKAKRWVS